MKPEKIQERAAELAILMGEISYQRMQKAEAVLLLIWDDLPMYLQAADRAGKQAQFIKLLDDWAQSR